MSVIIIKRCKNKIKKYKIKNNGTKYIKKNLNKYKKNFKIN